MSSSDTSVRGTTAGATRGSRSGDGGSKAAKYAILLYNIIQVVWNLHMGIGFLSRGWELKYGLIGNVQVPRDSIIEHFMYLYFINKIFDLIDTVIIIMKGKWVQLSFLHVYHHITVIGNAGMLYYITPYGDSYVPCAVNSLIHVLMYTYYGFALLNIRFPLPKSAVTVLQMVQFVFLIYLSIEGQRCCSAIPQGWVYTFQLLHVASFLYLFLDFFLARFSLWRTNWLWGVAAPIALLLPLPLLPADLVLLGGNGCLALSMRLMRLLAPFRFAETGVAAPETKSRVAVVFGRASIFEVWAVLMAHPGYHLIFDRRSMWWLQWVPAFNFYLGARGDLFVNASADPKTIEAWLKNRKVAHVALASTAAPSSKQPQQSSPAPPPAAAIHTAVLAVSRAQKFAVSVLTLENKVDSGLPGFTRKAPGPARPIITLVWSASN